MSQVDLEKTEQAVAQAEPDFSPRITSPYLIGVYLALNAIPDAYLFLDGPNCFPLKSPSIQGNHDWLSNLSNVAGRHRVVTTEVHPSTVIFSREKLFLDLLGQITDYEGTGGVFMSARPMAAITSLDYERILAKARETIGKPLMFLPPRSLSSNWLGGYEAAQLALAKTVDLTDAAPQKGKVAIVGYLHDRNEGDHQGNLAELRRLLGALDLDLEVVWFSGETFEGLRKVRNVSGIISLPYGRKAAKTLSERLDVPLVETCLPLGFGATERFLRQVGEAFGQGEAAEALIESELQRVIPALEWVVPFSLQNARVGFLGDPNHFAGIYDILDTVGAEMAFAGLAGERVRAGELPPEFPEERMLVEPTQRFLVGFVPQQIREEGLDLLVTNNVGTKLGNVPTLEFGYPSYYTHRLVPRPFLGFVGAAGIVEDMVNTMRQREFY